MKRTRNRRYGAAVVEMAICLPVLVLLTWGTIETTSSIFLKQTLTSAAHEGALVGMQLNATEAEIRDRVELVLESRQLEDCSIAITPSGIGFNNLRAGEIFSVNISKSSQNTFINLTTVSVTVSSQYP